MRMSSTSGAGKVGFGADPDEIPRPLLTDPSGRTQAADYSTHDLIEQMLIQLKLLVFHFSLMTDAEIDGDEMEMD